MRQETRYKTLLLVGSIASLVILPGMHPAYAVGPEPYADDAAQVIVSVGGDRSTDVEVDGLAGAQLGLFTAPEDSEAKAQCVSDSEGQCVLQVPTGLLGAQAWVKQISAPTGWNMNQVLRTGPGNNSTSTENPYLFQTPVLQQNEIYRSTADFMRSSDNSDESRSNGVWQNSRSNPPLPSSCGLDVALVFDLSESVGSALPDLKLAADAMVDGLTGTPSRVALFSFSAASPSSQTIGGVSTNHPELAPVSTQLSASAVKAQYKDWSLGKGTNWDAAFQAVGEAAEQYEVVLLLTDGNPTRWGHSAGMHGDGSRTHFTDLEAAIFSSNSLKARGTRVVAFGVGKGIEGATSLNLSALSGPIAFDGSDAAASDYFQVRDYSAAGDVLREIVNQSCVSTLTVVKELAPEGSTNADGVETVPANGGWQFAGASPDGSYDLLPSTATTTDDGTGAVSFGLVPQNTSGTGRVSISELQQEGFELLPQGGHKATCWDRATGKPLPLIDNPEDGVSIEIANGGSGTCRFVNAPVGSSGELSQVRIDKKWIVDGRAYEHGDQPAWMGAEALVDTGVTTGFERVEFGRDFGELTAGQTFLIDESAWVSQEGCALTSREITRTPDGSTHAALPYEAEVGLSDSSWEVTNVVTCASAPEPTAPTKPSENASLPETGDSTRPGALYIGFGALIVGTGLLLSAAVARRRLA